MENLVLSTREGNATGYLFRAKGVETAPLVIMFMDAFGPRNALFELSDQISSFGVSVFLPDLFFRFGEYEAFDVATTFQVPAERERIMGMMGTLSIASVMSDTRAWLEVLADDPQLDMRKIGAVGYCMGGKFAIATAATFPMQLRAAASIHGGGLVNPQPDSIHRHLSGIQADLYFGIATKDRSFTPENQAELEAAIKLSGVKAELEVYEGFLHGFAVRDNTVYDESASLRHLRKLESLFSSLS